MFGERDELLGQPFLAQFQSRQGDFPETTPLAGLSDHAQFFQLAKRVGQALGDQIQALGLQLLAAPFMELPHPYVVVVSASTAAPSGTIPFTGGKITPPGPSA